MLEIGCGIGLTGTALGLTAAVAAALAGGALPTLTLTDVNPIVLENLRYNAALNDPASNEEAMPIAAALLRAAAARAGCAAGGEEGASAARAVACVGAPIAQAERAGGDGGDDRRSASAPAAGLYRVASHDWSLPLAGGAGAAEACGWGADAGLSRAGRCPCARGARCAGGAFDVILASDAICCDEDARGVACSLARHLRRPGGAPPCGLATECCAPHCEGAAAPSLARFQEHGGVGLLLLPPPFTRYGIAALAGALQEFGLDASQQRVAPVFVPLGGGGAASEGSDAADIVTAGGREGELQLWVVSWPAGGGT